MVVLSISSMRYNSTFCETTTLLLRTKDVMTGWCILAMILISICNFNIPLFSFVRRNLKHIKHFLFQEEYSQPFLKPPHLEQPISTLLLSESSMVFGRTLVNDSEGNYKGPLTLSLKEGYALKTHLNCFC